MEKKSSSFMGRHGRKSHENYFSPKSTGHSTILEGDNQHENSTTVERENDDELLNHGQDVDQLSVDIDRFADVLSTANDKSNPPEVPDSVETFSRIVESRIAKYNKSSERRFGKMTEEDTFFIEAVKRLSKLTNAFTEFPNSSSLNRTSNVLQHAMMFLEEELRALLEDSRSCDPISNSKLDTKADSHSKAMSAKNSSFKSDRCSVVPKETESIKEEDFPGYSSEIITRMNKIVTAMLSAGYETECCQVYSMARKNALFEQVKKLEFEKINVEDVQKLNWEALEGEVTRWINIVKHCSGLLFPEEQKLGKEIFSDNPSISESLFSNLARGVIILLLDFTEAVVMTKRSAEKLFKFLDMYESLRNLIPAISESHSGEHELNSEISAAGDRIGEAVVNIFSDLENSIRNDVAKTPVPGGAVHPLTRYVMNYVKYACEYKDTLEQIFQHHAKISTAQTMEDETSPFSAQILSVMDLLDANLEAKSGLYKDPSLRYIFLMNNGRYILQKAKGAPEVHRVMGDTWCRRRSTEVRHFHKNYQRETWGKLLNCITQEGLQVNGKVNRQLLKERFKNFNNMFDEIHKTQSTWVVSEDQLVSELRVSISAVVTPAYRSFLGRFKQHLDSGKSAEKYIRYQPEDIETLIDTLFDGNPTSMGRKKT